MIAKILLLLFPIAMIILPALCYRRKTKRSLAFWRRMVTSHNLPKFVVNILALAVIALHICYYAAFPLDFGIMVSTLFIIALLSTKRSYKFLMLLRSKQRYLLIWACAILSLLFFPPQPHFTFLSTCFSMGLILLAASFMPSKAIFTSYVAWLEVELERKQKGEYAEDFGVWYKKDGIIDDDSLLYWYFLP